MRALLASTVALGVLIVFFPVLCVQGEDDPGSCSSIVGVRLPGTADHAEWWQLIVFVVAVLAWVLILRVRRRGAARRDLG